MGIGISSVSCNKSQAMHEQWSDPQIKAGVVKIHGKLNDPRSQIPFLILRFRNLVTLSENIIETQIEEDGSFYFETPIECSVVFSSIYYPGRGSVMIELFFNEDKKVDLSLDTSGKLKIDNITGSSLLTNSDKDNYNSVMERYITFRVNNPELLCEMTPEEYANNEMNMMQVRIDYAMKDAKLSDAGKNFFSNELKLFHLRGTLLQPKERIELICRNNENLHFQEPDILYYTFLKSFYLSNLQYIYCLNYSIMTERLLSEKAFNIPPIANTPVEEWLGRVKATLSDLVGFDTGQFYDLLAANSYAKQFNDEVVPLTEIQKSNIKNYFGDSEISKILLRKNEEVIDLAEKKHAVFVNKTPEVSKEQLMDAIIFKYKNKVVLVDFWATWCSPCLDAMVRIDAIKNQLNDRVIFVYITNGSSPRDIWDKKINSIRGEHYYLKGDEWTYLMESFGFNGIPSYVIFDTKGVKRDVLTGFPGKEEMQAMIEKLLP